MSDDLHDGRPGQPEKLGPYRLGERLGAGGMGQVFRAYDERLERWVAIKQILPGNLEAAEARQRFRREARAVASLNHPSIVQIYDVLETEHGDWIVTELVEGRDLRGLIPEHGLEPAKVLALARQVAEGLAEAHGKGIVHRDLKSENVMVTPAGQAKILDFGLAKTPFSELDDPTLSRPGIVLGTSRAMSPEQATGDPVDHRSDLFSLGTLLYEMTSGRSPFQGERRSQTLSRICVHRQRSLLELKPGVPPELSSLVDDLLEKDSALRPQSASAVATALAAIGTGPGTVADRDASPAPPAEAAPPARSGGASAAPLLSPSTTNRRHPSDLRTLTGEVSDAVALKTLLVIDLIDSGKLIETLGDARAFDIQARHDRLARDLVARHQGREIDKTDGFLLLFQRPVDAVECALAYHAALAELSRQIGVRIQAGAGIHLGEVFLHENTPEDVARGAKPIEVEGLAKPIAARAMSLARGGQTLLTQGVYELARRALVGSQSHAGNLRWLAHGAYRFKGVDEDFQVFEVGVEGVAPLAAPRSTAKVRRRRGRGPALAAAVLLLVVMIAAFALRSFRSAGLIQARPTVSVLGFKNLSQRPEEAWLSTALAELVSAELAAGGHLRLIPGENVARMKRELTLHEAETFASDTLRGIRRNLGTDYVIVGSYVALKQDEGTRIQLMLNLQDTESGETVAALPEQGTDSRLFELVSRVGKSVRKSLGVGEIQEAEANAVRASISSNVEATRLYSEGLEKLRAYDALAARDLLERAVEAHSEFALAHAALGEAWAALGHDRQAEESARQALDLAQDLPREEVLSIEGRYFEASAQMPKAVQTYQTLWGFFPDSVDYGLRLARAQRIAGEAPEALATVQALHELPEPVGSDPRIDLVEADVAYSLSDHRLELAAAERAARQGEEREARILTAAAWWRQGRALSRLGETAEAEAAFEPARQLFADVGDRGREARVLNSQAALLSSQGRSDEAEDLYRQALAIYRQTGNRKWASTLLNNLAGQSRRRGDLAAAKRMYEESLAIVREIGDRDREAVRLINLGWVLFEQAELAAAAEMAEDGLELNRELGRRGGVAWELVLAGLLAFDRGALEVAAARYGEALEICQEIGNQHLCGNVLSDMAELALAAGDLEVAAVRLDEAEAIREELQERSNLASTRRIRAELLLELGRAPEAEAMARRSREVLAEARSRDDELRAGTVLVLAVLAQERLAEAGTLAAGQRAEAAASQNPRVRLAAELAAARVAAAAGDRGLAMRDLQAVRIEAARLGLGRIADRAAAPPRGIEALTG